MIFDFKNLRPSPDYPVYPPYHTGDYLEEYFYSFYLKNKKQFDDINFTLIPIFWTNVYITSKNRHLLQDYINALPKNKRYFTVSQHDDAVQETLPVNTISFAAGGRSGGIPIPLICSPLPDSYMQENINRDIICSFVGSISTVSGLRQNMYNALQSQKGFYFSEPRWWTPTIPNNKLKEFIDITRRSWFTLCPRGYGLQSFRMFEALQLKSIPIFIYNPEWFPFQDFVNWDTFCIKVHEKDIQNIPNIVSSLSISDRLKLIQEGQRVYREFFTREQTCRYILKTLELKK